MRALALIRTPRPQVTTAPEAADVDTIDVRLGPAWIDPTDPMDNWHRSRAQSLLAGTYFRDMSRNPGPLTLDQSRDVIAWATGRIL